MGRIAHVVSRFPGDELAVHRLYARDARFRAVCDDYEESRAALEHWETIDAARAADFRELSSEIEAEIVGYLEREAGGRRPGGR